MIRTYRCYACAGERGLLGRDFTQEIDTEQPLVKLDDGTKGYKAVCPECGLSNTDKDVGGNVVPVVVIHFEAPFSAKMAGRKGCGHIACDHSQHTAASDTLRYTGEPGVVNCERCKGTPEYKLATTGVVDHTYEVRE